MAVLTNVPIWGNLSVFQTAFSVLALLFPAVLLYQRYLSPISHVPGPLLGSFGTCFQLWEIYKGSTTKSLLRLHQKYGPFVRISYNEVSVDHPEALQILSAQLRKADFYKLFAIPNINYNNLMSERDPKHHASMRANVGSAYSLSNLLRNESVIDATIELMEQRLDEAIQRRATFELSPWIHYLTWDIVGEVTFSRRFGFLDQGKDVGNALENGLALALYVTVMTYVQWLHSILLGNPILRWIDFQPNETTYNFCVSSIATRKQSTEARVDMMEHWLKLQSERPDLMTEKDLIGTVAGNIGAGGDTAGATIQGILYQLLKSDPVHLQRLKQEIDASDAASVLSPSISYAETQKLPYLQAVIKEGIRLHPGVPWNLPRVVPKEGFTVAGQNFTAGTILSVNPWLIHRNKDCFGKDAEVYNPERWLRDPAEVKHIEKFLVPFGLGYNACPGRNLASMELSKITATLIRDFDIHLGDPNCEWKFHELFIAPQRDWPVWMKRRVRHQKA